MLGRDPEARRLVSAYPIVDEQGRIIGALGLRSAQVPGTSVWRVLASISALAVGQVVSVATVGAIVSGIAGFILARRFGRRLQALEEATEAIAGGRLDQRVIVTAPDEIGRLGERFNLLAARLEEVDRGRRAFVSNISHELRTPLAIIRGHVEAQLGRAAGAAPTVPIDEALRVIAHETRTLGGLIDDLFTLTRLEEAALPLRPVPTHLPDIVNAAVAGLRPLARAQGKIAVRSLVPPDLPPVLADPTRVGQILNNLLYNALRHTPDGGVIVVEAAPRPDAAVIEVRVTDTGAGIAPDDLPHIFDRFYRGEAGRRREGGSGLGLAIVKHLVEAQGGAVGAASAPGEGTSIRFTLPRAAVKGEGRRADPMARVG